MKGSVESTPLGMQHFSVTEPSVAESVGTFVGWPFYTNSPGNQTHSWDKGPRLKAKRSEPLESCIYIYIYIYISGWPFHDTNRP